MICPRGHGFDGPLDSLQCPICGTELERLPRDGDRFEITRADLRILREGLRVAAALAEVVKEDGWCSHEEADLIQKAQTRIELVRNRAGYRTAKSEQTCGHPDGATVEQDQLREAGAGKETER